MYLILRGALFSQSAPAPTAISRQATSELPMTLNVNIDLGYEMVEQYIANLIRKFGGEA